MEANTPQKNSSTDSLQDVTFGSISNQIKYPLDYVSQEVIRYFTNFAYPVGSVYINTTNPNNPSLILKVGTWIAIEGYVIAGYKSGDAYFGTAGSTVGSSTVTLTESEIPAHTHVAQNTGSAGSGTFAWAGQAGNTATFVSGSTGGGASHNNIQPTLVAYVWQRTQ